MVSNSRQLVFLTAGAALWLLLALSVNSQIVEVWTKWVPCKGNSKTLESLKSTQNFTVEEIDGVGLGFYFVNKALSPLYGGPNVTRGLLILPEENVAPEAYAPYAYDIARLGFYVSILDEPSVKKVLPAMMQHPELQFWSLAGHGKGGEIAARVALTLQPKVKSLVLIAAPLPQDVDLRSINVFLSVIYGALDTLTTPATVTGSFDRVAGDTSVTELPDVGHYDFAYSTCAGNSKVPASNGNDNSTVLTTTVSTAITGVLSASLEFLQWFSGTQGALSYGDNHYLTPGFNDSKPYSGNILVKFDEVIVPGTSPQRVWWVFTPSTIKGGVVYYCGAAVDGRAYFPMAFEIAARGHLVVIPQQPSRNSLTFFKAANAIIDSKLPIFAGVPAGRWAIGGHSLGGVAVTSYVACYGNKIYGAVLHSGGWNVNTNASEVPILQLYGSIDNVSGRGKDSQKLRYLSVVNLNKTTFLSIPGANHYQVGDYGYQYHDQIATISLETQHSIYANETVNFLDALPSKIYAPVLPTFLCAGL